jgi:hypothetical protein
MTVNSMGAFGELSASQVNYHPSTRQASTRAREMSFIGDLSHSLPQHIPMRAETDSFSKMLAKIITNTKEQLKLQKYRKKQQTAVN